MTSSGWDDPEIQALPFTAEIEAPNFSFSIGFRAELVVGLELLQTVDVGASMFFDLPRLTVAVAEVDQVNTKCERATEQQDAVDHPLLHIAPQVEVGLGIQGVALVGVGRVDVGLEAETTLLSTAFPLPTQCLDFRPDERSYVAADAVAAPAPDTTEIIKPSQGSPVRDGTALRLVTVVSVALGLLSTALAFL